MPNRTRKSPDGKASPIRPMDAAYPDRARRIVAEYSILLEPQDDATFLGRSIELPHCLGQGPTAEACLASTHRVLEATVATMLEAGHRPPPPARERMRTEQVNIRLTQEEKLLLEQAARIKGFQNLSSYIRSAALSGAK